MRQPLSIVYAGLVEAGTLTPDPAQARAVAALDGLADALSARRRTLFGRGEAPRGLYLWGPPGRGKSMLMDLFYAQASEPKKRRAHFHAFMAEVHGLIRKWREGDASERKAAFGTTRGDDPIAPLAALIAKRTRLLCFDEFMVTDIADAMILGRLFEALFEKGVVLVATSNRAPVDLYRDGINRQLFLPFIDLIEENCAVVAVAGERDWRLHRLMGRPVWFAPDDAGQVRAFEALWDEMRGGEPEEPATLTVAGRRLTLQRTAGGLARAGFDALCERPLGAQDYLAVAARFHTLFLERLPVLGEEKRQPAARFVRLIDALYEARCVLIVLAEAAPEALRPDVTTAFEFERTVSRLNEMASADWLTAAREEGGASSEALD